MKILTCFLTLLSVIPAFAQLDVAPPPKPVDNGPSLADTLKFIADKVSGQGPVNFVLYWHDNVDGSDSTNTARVEFEKFTPVPADCRLAYHFLQRQDGRTLLDGYRDIKLRTVTEIVVEPYEQVQKRADARAGAPEFSVHTDPAVFVVTVKHSDGPVNELYFFDETLANRVAKALVHAVELCGGGSKELF